MEVHKHPHHVTHKKKWGEYLLEFFMLFLAVFLGFLAENYREHIVERRIEKHYMESMVEDLQKDTAMLNTIINRAGRITNLLDTAERILFLEKMNDSLIKKLYSFNLKMLPSIQTTFADRTTSQLKNAGGLHLIRNVIVVENLFDYWTFTEEINHNAENYNELRLHAREKSYGIFSAKYYTSESGNNNLSPGVTPKLMTSDRSILEEFANRLGHLKNGNQFVYIPNLKAAFAAVVKLMTLIKTEYHLENE